MRLRLSPEAWSAAAHALDEEGAVRLLGEVVAIADGVHLGRAAYEEMVAAALEAIDAQGSVTVAALRDRFGTSRKYALALLEHLDDERITRRVGDARVRGSRAPRDRR